jgi:hypothetical protein
VVVEQVLGLKSIPDATKKHTQDQSDDEDESAFELLRVCIFPPHHATCSSNRCQVRNRFASSNSVGGYRDINFKIRVGFKCDSTKGRPLFCSVSVSLRWTLVVVASTYSVVQEALAPGGCEDNCATICVDA